MKAKLVYATKTCMSRGSIYFDEIITEQDHVL